MLKNVLPKVLFVAGIVGIIAVGNYFFKEVPVDTPAEQSTTAEENNE